MTIERFSPMFVNNATELSRAINVFNYSKQKKMIREQKILRRHFNEVKEFFLDSYVNKGYYYKFLINEFLIKQITCTSELSQYTQTQDKERINMNLFTSNITITCDMSFFLLLLFRCPIYTCSHTLLSRHHCLDILLYNGQNPSISIHTYLSRYLDIFISTPRYLDIKMQVRRKHLDVFKS